DLDLYTDTVYCFTPTGDVKTLPAGSNTIDFAYSIHSAVGNKMIGARVNGRLVTIDYVVNNGDRIEIITSQNSKGPSRDWLNIVKSTQAKSKINQWFKNELKESNIIKGKEMLLAYCRSKGVDPQLLLKPEYMKLIMEKYGFKEWDAVRAAVGHGGLKEGQIINKMMDYYEKDHPKILSNEEVLKNTEEAQKERKLKVRTSGGIAIEGTDNVAVRFSKCCSPIPGDEIVGFVTRGRGVSIHRTDCINILNLPQEERVRIIEAEWQEQPEESGRYVAEINIYSNNRDGLLAEITRVVTEKGVSILSMNMRTSKQGTATTCISFEITNTEELNRLIERIGSLEGIIDIERTRG
ncbi:MAG: bifunctional (p)ppGpp synthetase/guanosine-3',5'-bis(diphosphate) 3'-pyrophosphohydrolase, partial [Lachnospiraceae bacterium]|nr:bifunctional (p)ppGpp synthetase/guanosine-3',5'-bis(diphosphate) 3'-pyrophosphohydrolase [Lachnospiraceae bacterium]